MTQHTAWDDGRTPLRLRWVAVAVMLAAVAVTGALVGGGVATHDQSSLRIEEAAAPRAVVDAGPAAAAAIGDLAPGALLPGRWTAIESGPLTGRSLARMTWTGREAMIWGGLGEQPLADGAAYDPAANGWTMLPESPLSPRFDHAAVWTGTEVVIAGGASAAVPGGPHVLDLADAAAYNPATGRWRRVPSLPFPTGAGRLFTVRGRLFAIAADVRPVSIAVLEQGARQWSGLDAPRPGGTRGDTAGPLQAGVAHDELVVWHRHGGGTGVAIDTADPSQWRPLGFAPQPLTSIATCCVLVAGEGDAGVELIVYDRARDVWRRLAHDTSAQLAVSGQLAFVVRLDGSSGAVDLRTGKPLRLPAAPITPRRGVAAVWAGDRLLVWGGADGDQRAADGAAFVMPPP